MSRYDDIDHLLQDLEMERRYKDSIECENSDLEKTIIELEGYLRHLDEVAVNGSAEDNEWKARYEIQKNLDINLSEHRSWLEAELGEMEWKYHTSSYPEAMNCNVDLLTELELVRLVKHMERVKNDYHNTVRDTEYKTDKETKDFHHMDDVRRTYKSDLKHVGHNMERLKMEEILERQHACTPPLFSPSYVRWLDSQSLDESGLGLKSKSKHRSKSLSKEGRRSTSKSPTRSKSRSDKSRKKDESEDPEPTTEAEAATTDQGEDKGAASGGEAAATKEGAEGGGEEEKK